MTEARRRGAVDLASDPLRLAPSRVVRAEDLGTVMEARELLSRARSRAEEILRQAREDAERIRAAAADAAAAEIERGYASGLARAQQEFAAKVAVRGGEDARRFASQEERMCLLVTRTLEKVLSESNNDERFFAGVMSRVLRAAREEKYLTVRVSADQREAADKAIRGLVEQTAAPNFIEVLGDPAVGRGACIVESAHGVIDASLDTQMDAIRNALLSAWRPERPDRD